MVLKPDKHTETDGSHWVELFYANHEARQHITVRGTSEDLPRLRVTRPAERNYVLTSQLSGND